MDDTGEVVNEVVSDGAGGAKVVKGEIVAVVGCRSCRGCKAKMVEVGQVLGECTKCGMKMKMARCGQSFAARPVRLAPITCPLYSRTLLSINAHNWARTSSTHFSYLRKFMYVSILAVHGSISFSD